MLLLPLFAGFSQEVNKMSIFERRPLCNNNPSSAPLINGKVFILCWRCIGAILGIVVATVLWRISVLTISLSNTVLFSVLFIPGAIDYFGIKLGIVTANNLRRMVTGMMIGFPFAMYIILLLF